MKTGKRGPKKGHGGRPRKNFDGKAQTISLDESEWELLRQVTQHPGSWRDCVDAVIVIAEKSTQSSREKVRSNWGQQWRKKAPRMENRVDRTIHFSVKDLEFLDEIAPSWGFSGSDRVRQVLELASMTTQ